MRLTKSFNINSKWSVVYAIIDRIFPYWWCLPVNNKLFFQCTFHIHTCVAALCCLLWLALTASSLQSTLSVGYVSHSFTFSVIHNFYCFTICVCICICICHKDSTKLLPKCHFNLICTCTCICHIVKCFSEASIILKHISMQCYISITKDVWARVYTEIHASILWLSFFLGYSI